MAKPNYIELGFGKHAQQIPILYEDRSVIAIDKPRGWMLVPFSWQKTNRNLQAAITSSIAAGDYWAKSRNLKFLRFVHRIDADTTGILLFAKSQGALDAYSDLFEMRKIEKMYFAVVHGEPTSREWSCSLKLAPNPEEIGRVKIDPRNGKDAETHFKVLETRTKGIQKFSLIECRPVTGRTHQIRVHLTESGYPIVGDDLYAPAKNVNPNTPKPVDFPLGLRALSLSYTDPFQRRRVEIRADAERFLKEFGFKIPSKATTA